MKIKDSSVRFVDIKPGILYAFPIIEEIYQHFGHECVITSLNDSKHMKGSLHYKGQAVDIRTRYFDSNTLAQVYNELVRRLGKKYDVVLEGNHIHVEFDPK